MPDDPYAVLGLAPGASQQEIADAYRTLAQIYHPDRYAEAPARVRQEANTRMQAVNAAFAQLRRSAVPRSGSAAGARDVRRPPPPPPAPAKPEFVHYVDGAKGYHAGDVAPLGVAPNGDALHDHAAKRCSKLDGELRQWFDQQRRNASVPAKKLYESWDAEQQARYSAKLGCSQVPATKARSFGVPCPECRP